ncbi:hypothetical protein [Shimia sp.]|uniref:hypothetical protein n=1 Tax=Shimia sp. TaxID=1954381 RepID=UPI003297585B
MSPHKFCVLALCLGCSGVYAQESFGPTERLEIWRHARLQATRNDHASVLAEFTTDGCSGGMSAAWETVSTIFPNFALAHEQHPPWEACCVTHDHAYHLGGENDDPVASFEARIAADQALKICVIETSKLRSLDLQQQYDVSEQQVTWAYERIAKGMYDAVRLGGAPCSGLPWRWGYGWPQCW